MTVPILQPAGFVPPVAVAFADPTNQSSTVSATNPLPVTVVAGASSTTLADQSVVDAVGIYWLVRDNGTALTYLSWATGTAGTPTAPVAPAGKLTGEQVRGTQYNATAAGTGYAVGDVLEHIVILNIATAPASVLASTWLNITQGLVLTAPPAAANLGELTATTNANLMIGGNVVTAGNPVPTQVSSSLPAGTNLVGKFVPTFAASGLTPVTGLITAGTQSAAFTPQSGRDFNITVVSAGAGTNTAQIERQFPGDTTWYVLITDTMRSNLAPSFSWIEGEVGVSYRVNVLAGQFLVRLSQ